MKISKIIVNNFRSIKHAEIEPTAFNIFIGQNNHGKTNFFEAIDWFYGTKGDIEKIRFGRSGEEEVSVEIEFSEIQDGIEKMKNAKNKTAIKERFGNYETIKVKRTNLSKVRQIFDEKENKWLEKNPTGFDSAFNDFLPSLEYVSTLISPMDMAKYGKNTPIANMLSGVLSAILEKDPAYLKFKEQFDNLFTKSDSQIRVELDKLSSQVKIHLEKQFPDCEKVVFEVSPPIFEDLLKKFETSIDDGVYTNADEKGDGMQRALMLAIIRAYADFRREHEETSKFFLFFIDEGELHLHPTAQRNLKNALLELANGGDQVFINTHSSVLVSDNTEGQTIFKVEKISGETSITVASEIEKPYIVYDLLGGSPTDLLLPANFFIVEGKSDFEFISKIIERFYSDKKKIQIIYAEGDHERQRQSMEGINKVFQPLFTNPVYKDKLVILCEVPHESKKADFENFKKSFPYLEQQNQLFQIPVNNIEEYYPNSWGKSKEEIEKMDEKNAKIMLAREVGTKITKEQFEKDMEIIFKALKKCWDSAY